VNRIFLTLASLATVTLCVSFYLGLNIDDPRERTESAQNLVAVHLLTALGSLVFAGFIHALAFTYFMGTSRWLEETSQAYRLPDTWTRENRSLKYRILPSLMFSMLLLILTAAFGGAADPASPVSFQGWGGVSPATIHLSIACLTLAVNFYANIVEYTAIFRNGQVIQQVVAEVRRIRTEKGLPV